MPQSWPITGTIRKPGTQDPASGVLIALPPKGLQSTSAVVATPIKDNGTFTITLEANSEWTLVVIPDDAGFPYAFGNVDVVGNINTDVTPPKPASNYGDPQSLAEIMDNSRVHAALSSALMSASAGGAEAPDTGWLRVGNFPGVGHASLPIHAIRLKRRGTRVSVVLSGDKSLLSSYQPPEGFRLPSMANFQVVPVVDDAIAPAGSALLEGGGLFLDGVTSQIFNAYFEFETDDAWPTTIPGSEL